MDKKRPTNKKGKKREKERSARCSAEFELIQNNVKAQEDTAKQGGRRGGGQILGGGGYSCTRGYLAGDKAGPVNHRGVSCRGGGRGGHGEGKTVTRASQREKTIGCRNMVPGIKKRGGTKTRGVEGGKGGGDRQKGRKMFLSAIRGHHK